MARLGQSRLQCFKDQRTQILEFPILIEDSPSGCLQDCFLDHVMIIVFLLVTWMKIWAEGFLVKILCLHCRGHDLILGFRIKIPMLRGTAKKKKKKKKKRKRKRKKKKMSKMANIFRRD